MRVVEIFQSIDGEGPRAGYLANFIRLAGCNLRCSYCDTQYAQQENCGNDMTVDEILDKLDSNIHSVTLTGGEPLLHNENALALIGALAENGYDVSVETNGSIDITPFMKNYVSFVVDYKLPSGGENGKMLMSNFDNLRGIDCIKFVAGDDNDLDVMRDFCCKLSCPAQLFVSPVFGKIEPLVIVEYLKQHSLNNIRLQLQLHKYIWQPDKRGV